MEHIRFIRKISPIIGLSKTDFEIIVSLSEGQKLLVSEIAQHIKRSKRHVYQRLHSLLEKGLLERELEVLKNKRIAYRYYLRSIRSIAEEIRIYLLKKIAELDDIVMEQKRVPGRV
ncbi:MAG: hypothetical protein DRN05_01005 [Thermoplasmata archaeon]|nr:MAG: hypothetical protein DRN05_01005 [Thermoplasmata archaeon]